MTLKPRFDNILGKYQRKPWFRFITPSNEHLASDDALDLVDKLLRHVILYCTYVKCVSFNFTYFFMEDRVIEFVSLMNMQI